MSQRGRLGRVRRASGCAIAATTLLLVLPAGAIARPGDEVRPRSLHLGLASIATRGYLINVETTGHHRVILNVEKGSQLASYAVRGEVSRHRIKADFGRFGRVSLRFRGRARPFATLPDLRRKSARQRRHCSGRHPEREVGHFRGTVEFKGQRAFTRLAVGKAPGEVRRTYRQICRPPRKGARAAISSSASTSPFGFTITVLTARSRVDGALTQFSAISLQAPLGVRLPGNDVFSLVSATLQERVGRVRILRSTLQETKPGAIKVSRRGVRPRRARVALKSPFSGSARYTGPTKASPASWTGSLDVRLLGTGALPLTGPHFDATLCRASAFNPANPCFRQAEASLAAAQGNGSRSHPLAEATR
jgi:hypothetical protein